MRVHYLLFGQIGVGKSFLGRLIEENFGVPFLEGDAFITDPMREAIARRDPFTPEMRAAFVDVLSAEIAARLDSGPFCLAQALFKNVERQTLRERFPGLRLVWVRAEPDTISRRLRERADHIADAAYAEFANPHFEAPNFDAPAVDNNGSPEDALDRFAAIAGFSPPRRRNAKGQ